MIVSSPIPDAMDKISLLRHRHQRLMESIDHYESVVDDQQSQLKQLHRPRDEDGDGDEPEDPDDEESDRGPGDFVMSEEEMKKEEEEIRELERKKMILEDRVSSLGKDITGVLR
jgi:hypothetical protein